MSPAIDPRLPVLIGAGQHNQRVDRGDPALEPTDLMAIALDKASASAGTADAAKVLAGADTVGVVSVLSWRYRDPGCARGGSRLARGPRRTIYTSAGGNSPQSLVNRMALDIQDGRADLALLVGPRRGAPAWRPDRSTNVRNGPCKRTTSPHRRRSVTTRP